MNHQLLWIQEDSQILIYLLMSCLWRMNYGVVLVLALGRKFPEPRLAISAVTFLVLISALIINIRLRSFFGILTETSIPVGWLDPSD